MNSEISFLADRTSNPLTAQCSICQQHTFVCQGNSTRQDPKAKLDQFKNETLIIKLPNSLIPLYIVLLMWQCTGL